MSFYFIFSWSDGLPKEHLCVPAVLSRIAVMALIRNKVLQYEDVNGPTSISTDVSLIVLLSGCKYLSLIIIQV